MGWKIREFGSNDFCFFNNIQGKSNQLKMRVKGGYGKSKRLKSEPTREIILISQQGMEVSSHHAEIHAILRAWHATSYFHAFALAAPCVWNTSVLANSILPFKIQARKLPFRETLVNVSFSRADTTAFEKNNLYLYPQFLTHNRYSVNSD